MKGMQVSRWESEQVKEGAGPGKERSRRASHLLTGTLAHFLYPARQATFIPEG